MTEKKITVREACRRQMPLDGADSQCLEHALTITERERDAAIARAEKAEAEIRAFQELKRKYEGDEIVAEQERDSLRALLRDVLAWKVDGSDYEYESRQVLKCLQEGATPDWLAESAALMGCASAEDHKALLARLREAGVVEEVKP
jgi:hypothetical protein